MESGESLGFLPGTVEEKTGPFMKSYFTNYEKILDKYIIDGCRSQGDITVEPLAYLRGRTLDNSIILLDEAQNATMKQLMLWITRLGKNSKAVLMADISQYDIQKKDLKIFDFIKMIEGVEGVGIFEFTSVDIVRNKILIDIVNRYEKYRFENEK